MGSYKWEVVLWLWLAFFLKQADRQVYNVVLPLIRDDLHLSDAQMGLIASVFMWTLGGLVPLAGYLADVVSKKWVIAVSLFVWSSATMLTGVSTAPIHLLLFRGVCTGGGEAFHGPAANTLLAEYHHKTRALAMSIHQTSLYVGVICSGFLAGYVGQTWGWRAAFYVFGALGVVLAGFVAVRLKDVSAPCGSAAPQERRERPSPIAALSVLVRTPTALLLTVAFSSMIFVNIGYLTWMPTFLVEKFGLSLAHAGFSSMFYHHVFAFIGVLVGGRLSDRWAQGHPKARMQIQLVGLLVAAPFIYLTGAGRSMAVTYVGLAGFGLFRGFYDSSIFAALYEVVEPKYRALASGMMVMFAFLTGAFASCILGFLKPTLGLSAGISSLAGVYIVGAVAVFIGLKFFFARDYYDEKGGVKQTA